ncbi:ShlB/FhaC/HecB family hemolysin secretion/activation protein [Testudinibacter sp. P27/CKL/0425]
MTMINLPTLQRARYSLFSIFFSASMVYALPNDVDVLDLQQITHQQQQDKQLQKQMSSLQDIRFDKIAEKKITLPATEKHCLMIHTLSLNEWNNDHYQKSPLKKRFPSLLNTIKTELGLTLPRCLGLESIEIISSQLQNELIRQGYITTRVYVEDQDINQGVITFTVVPGRIRHIDWKDTSTTPRWKSGLIFSGLPLKQGDLLNIRSLEQGLENFKRVPSSDLNIQIIPNESENALVGESDLLLEYHQQFPLRFSLGLNDAGNKSTGRLQTNIGVALDNPFSLNDLFYLNFSHSFKQGSDMPDKRRAHNVSFGYSMPWKNWLFSAFFSQHYYHQTVFGFYTNYQYWGKSKNGSLKGSYLLHRNSMQKTYFDVGIWQRQSNNFIDDVEINTQRRRIAGWDIGIRHQYFFQHSTLHIGLNYKKGTGMLGAIPEPNKKLSRPEMLSANLQFYQAIQVNKFQGYASTDWQFQWSKSPLLAHDLLSLGGRYTVRGFSGDLTLSGERGWIARNEIGWHHRQNHQVYLAVDLGRISGESQKSHKAKMLIGSAIGMKGDFSGYGDLGYDFFIGKPIYKPKHFNVDKHILGFNLTYSF